MADVYLTSRAAALPAVRWAYGDDDVRLWVKNALIPSSDVVVSERDGAVVAFLALDGDFVQQLYVLPAYWRSGLGSDLLGAAKSKSPDGLRLYCFQQNRRARSFYEQHGFRAISFTDGADNEEREPDALYAWPGFNATST